MRSSHLTLIRSEEPSTAGPAPAHPRPPGLRVVREPEDGAATALAPRPEPGADRELAAALEELELLELPCPPMLATALGYPGSRRYVAVVRSTDPTPLRVDDGAGSHPADAAVWRALVTHPCSRAALEPHSLDDGLPHPRHAVLVDLDELVVFAGDRDAVTRVLARSVDEHRSPAALEAGCVERWLEDPTLGLAS